MNYLAVIFLEINRYNEENAFLMLLGFILSKQLRGMFIGNMSEYHLKNYVLQQLLKKYLPDRLWVHIAKRMYVNLEMITTAWIMTFFI